MMAPVQAAVAAPQPTIANGACAPQPAAQPTLLPEPEQSAVDPLTAMAFLLAKGRSAGLEDARGDINVAKNDRASARKLELDALRKAAQAEDDGGMWRDLSKKCGTVAKIAAVAGSVALAVGTGGAATPAVVLAWSGAGLSAASFVQGETRALQALGVSDEWATKIELGMAVASGICSGGAAFSGLERANRVVETTTRVTSGVAGAAQVLSGVATFKTGQYDAEVIECMADAARAQMEVERMKRRILQLIADIDRSETCDRNTFASLRGAIEGMDQAKLASVRRV